MHERHGVRWAWRVLTLLILMGSCASAAVAGRGLPDPLMLQFAEGYGVVAAEVLSAEAPPFDERGDNTFGVKFRVVEVVADTVRLAPRLGLKTGDTFHVILTVGYGAIVERWGGTDGEGRVLPGEGQGPLDAGVRFYLKLRPQIMGGFEHALGADAAIRVDEFTEEKGSFFAHMRTLANLPRDRRFETELAWVSDSKMRDDCRLEALRSFAHRRFFAAPLSADESDRLRATLWALWMDEKARVTDDLLVTLDRALLDADASFGASIQREQRWHKRLFAPMPVAEPARTREIRRRDGWISWKLAEFAEHRPAATAELAMREMQNPAWPLALRWRLAGVIQRLYHVQDKPEASWEPALQDFYAASMLAATPWELRLIADSIEGGATAARAPKANAPAKRGFVGGAAVRQALAHALTRLDRMDEKLDENVPVAKADVQRALEALEALDRTVKH